LSIRERFDEERDLSEEVENYANNAYITEPEAAAAFAQAANAATQKDGNERVAMIINYKVPVVNNKGEIVKEKRSLLTDTLEGQPSNVIPQLFSMYFGSGGFRSQGATVSFVHTHPSGGDKFSGENSKTPADIYKQIGRYVFKKDKSHFSGYLGDAQVPWLPGVDKMYLVSPTYREIYVSDENGSLKDPTSKSGYKVVENY